MRPVSARLRTSGDREQVSPLISPVPNHLSTQRQPAPFDPAVGTSGVKGPTTRSSPRLARALPRRSQ